MKKIIDAKNKALYTIAFGIIVELVLYRRTYEEASLLFSTLIISPLYGILCRRLDDSELCQKKTVIKSCVGVIVTLIVNLCVYFVVYVQGGRLEQLAFIIPLDLICMTGSMLLMPLAANLLIITSFRLKKNSLLVAYFIAAVALCATYSLIYYIIIELLKASLAWMLAFCVLCFALSAIICFMRFRKACKEQ